MRISITCLVMTISFFLLSACSSGEPGVEAGSPRGCGDYLGMTPPGSEPEIFAAGIVSNGFHERRLAFSPAGDEICWTMTDDNYVMHHIVGMKKSDSGWTSPEVVSFSGVHPDMSPSFSPDGQRLFFGSRRPRPGSEEVVPNLDIWSVHREGDGWSTPVNIGSPINTDGREGNPFCWRETSISRLSAIRIVSGISISPVI
jgi:hypothetical protein